MILLLTVLSLTFGKLSALKLQPPYPDEGLYTTLPPDVKHHAYDLVPTKATELPTTSTMTHKLKTPHNEKNLTKNPVIDELHKVPESDVKGLNILQKLAQVVSLSKVSIGGKSYDEHSLSSETTQKSSETSIYMPDHTNTAVTDINIEVDKPEKHGKEVEKVPKDTMGGISFHERDKNDDLAVVPSSAANDTSLKTNRVPYNNTAVTLDRNIDLIPTKVKTTSCESEQTCNGTSNEGCKYGIICTSVLIFASSLYYYHSVGAFC